jgi:hypothetical protein
MSAPHNDMEQEYHIITFDEKSHRRCLLPADRLRPNPGSRDRANLDTTANKYSCGGLPYNPAYCYAYRRTFPDP